MPTLASLAVPPPRNWQDFEDLCCDLWRRLWRDPDAQKHGRGGQPQAGVDVFGRPGRGEEWAGIQCKVKVGGERLTRAEIDSEITKARTFDPPLRHFIIATTASRDVSAQRSVRVASQAPFTIRIACWEDILLDLAAFPDLIRKHYPMLMIEGDRGSSEADERAALHNPAPFTLPPTHRANPFFVPQGEVNAALSAMHSGDTVVLTGSAGVGKTQHAVQYAHEHRAQFSAVLWASASTVDGLHDALRSLADIVEPGTASARSAEDRQDTFQAWLQRHGEWLLILDNADAPEVADEIERWLPAAHEGCIIITSQYARWTGAFRTVPVTVWSEAMATQFLDGRLADRKDDRPLLARLASELGGLPLALEQAAAYISETRIPVGRYLDLLKHHGSPLFQLRYPGMTDYRDSIVATWRLADRRLQWLDRQILHYASVAAPEPIPRNVFTRLTAAARTDLTYGPLERQRLRLATTQDGVDRSLARLARYSLVSLSEDSVRVHMLLQRVICESAVLRPWQSRYWILRLWRVLGPLEVTASRLWRYRLIHLLDTDGVLPGRADDTALLEMRAYLPHIERSVEGMTALDGVIPVTRFRFLIPWFRDRFACYEAGVEAMHSLLDASVALNASLAEEAQWLKDNFEGLYTTGVRSANEHPIVHALRQLGVKPATARRDLFSLLWMLSQGLAESGSPAALRLYRFYANLAAMEAGECTWALLRQVQDLWKTLPRDECQRLLEEALEAPDMPGWHAITVWFGVTLYSHQAVTEEETARVLLWTGHALPHARKALLQYGLDDACLMTVERVNALERIGESALALDECEQTLRLAVRAKRLLKNRSVANLWLLRANLLAHQGRFLPAARSEARFLRRSTDSPSDPLARARLHCTTGEMYLAAAHVHAATRHFSIAEELLIGSSSWTEELQAVKARIQLDLQACSAGVTPALPYPS